MREITYEGFSLRVPHGWRDITAELDTPSAPLTIAEPVSGVGALQFSIAIYKGGRQPQITRAVLANLLDQNRSNHCLGDAFERSSQDAPLHVEAASYHKETDFVRVWYASDAINVIFATYTCAWEDRDREAREREIVVGSIRFRSN
jgi:hypothetical protein